jgi:alkanesulfonate monooxygenase SsuD/methylene tetrahydromethanopterin reductase-like flavin-dependent oxidoreductase (luciferase family)
VGRPGVVVKFSTFHLFHRFAGMSDRDVYNYQLELVDVVENSDFDGLWVAEHHFRDYGICPSVSGMLSHIAGRTERVRLGSGIVVLPLHNPVHIAEEIAQLDIVSGGRVQFGVGRGYQSIEFGGFKLDLSEARDRFNEALDIIIGLWTNERFPYEGRYYTVGDVKLEPTPLQRPHPPVKVAAVSPETVTMYAERGLPILADPATPFNRSKLAAETWLSVAEANGHDTGAADLTIMRLCHVAPTVEQARDDMVRHHTLFDRQTVFNEQSAPTDTSTGKVAKGFEYWDRYAKNKDVDNDFRWERQEVIGDPERVIRQIKELQSYGFSELMCDFGSSTRIPLEEMKQTIKLFSEEVIPAFR